MFCPKCGHQQATEDMRFCTRCGLSLEFAAEIVATGDAQLSRERREVAGIGWMIATVLILFNFLLVFGLVTLPHMTNPVYLGIWLLFFATALTTGGIGLANLKKGGFFRRLKERELRLELAKSEQRRQALSENAVGTSLTAAPLPRLAEPPSVTEGTTRELPIPRTTEDGK